jgi:hypothetical protein
MPITYPTSRNVIWPPFSSLILMMSADGLEDGTVCLTYRRPPAGHYGLLDRAPIGHNEGIAWLWIRHGGYYDANANKTGATSTSSSRAAVGRGIKWTSYVEPSGGLLRGKLVYRSH